MCMPLTLSVPPVLISGNCSNTKQGVLDHWLLREGNIIVIIYVPLKKIEIIQKQSNLRLTNDKV